MGFLPRKTALFLICTNFFTLVRSASIPELSQDVVDLHDAEIIGRVDIGHKRTVWTDGIIDLAPSTSFASLTGILTDFGSSCLPSDASEVYANILALNHQSSDHNWLSAPKIALILYDETCSLSTQLSALQSLGSGKNFDLNLVGILTYTNTSSPVTANPSFLPTFSIPRTVAFNLLNTFDSLASKNVIQDYDIPFKRYARITIHDASYAVAASASAKIDPTTQNRVTVLKKRGIESINTVACVVAGIVGGTILIISAAILFIYYKRTCSAYVEHHEAQIDMKSARRRFAHIKSGLLTKDMVNRFPLVSYDHGVTKNTECMFCMDELRAPYHYLDEEGQEKAIIKMVLVLPCKHGFCRMCDGIRGIEHWLTNVDRKCPVCYTDSLAPARKTPLKLDVSIATALAVKGSPLRRSPPHISLEMKDFNEAKRLTRSEVSSDVTTISFDENDLTVTGEMVVPADDENTFARNGGRISWGIPPSPRTPETPSTRHHSSIVIASNDLSERRLPGGGAWSSPNSPSVPYSVTIFTDTTLHATPAAGAWSTPTTPCVGTAGYKSEFITGPWRKLMNNGPWSAPLTSTHGVDEYDWKLTKVKEALY
ncbi:hypothetical protein BC936DRAFT_144849 [Jimgerdemannia flammicorona]|uniref:RING-type domain-containing protein n=1 Tax=Jimgerdemannia flammicorona TaxID=994334 RepID=A0A433DBH5_9FUNG|nr:hypothetical protein BC936DRAFT_144849 [Jimgerdemannia flammicorona]